MHPKAAPSTFCAEWTAPLQPHCHNLHFRLDVRRLGGRSKVTLGEEKHYGEYLPEILQNYGRCMQYGYRHRLQCLPRMLTLFCDWGNEHLSKKRQIQQRDRQTTSGVRP